MAKVLSTHSMGASTLHIPYQPRGAARQSAAASVVQLCAATPAQAVRQYSFLQLSRCKTASCARTRTPSPICIAHNSPDGTSSSTTTTTTTTAPADALPDSQEVPMAATAAPIPPGPAALSPVTQPLGQTQGSVWTHTWWPVMPVPYLDTTKPTPVTVMGINLVVWRDGGGVWQVWRDACPHRLAPLSEGRVEANGSLTCAYHGWAFSGGAPGRAGACTRIPQALDAAAEATACSSRRACASVYPSKEVDGLLWVWLDASEAAIEHAAAQPLPLPNARRAAADTADRLPPWYMREMPYPYEVLLENISDPAHLPFSHHGVAALNRADGRAMPMKTSSWQEFFSEPEDAPLASACTSGMRSTATATTATAPVPTTTDERVNPIAISPQHAPLAQMSFAGNIQRDAHISFTPPGLITYSYKWPGGGGGYNTFMYAVPVTPATSRFFERSVPFGPTPKPWAKPSAWQILTDTRARRKALQAWINPSNHMLINEVLDGDSVFLIAQARLLASMEAKRRQAASSHGSNGSGSNHGNDGSKKHNESVNCSPQGGSSHGNMGSDAERGGTGSGGDGAGAWRSAYFLATQADSLVRVVRQWIDMHGHGPFGGVMPGVHGGVHGSEVPMPGGAEERHAMLDRWMQHTRHCPMCKQQHAKLASCIAAAATARTLLLLGVGTVMASLAALATVNSALPTNATPGALTAAAVGGGLGGWLQALTHAAWSPMGLMLLLLCMGLWVCGVASTTAKEIKQQYEFVDYVHAHNQ